MDRTKLMKAVVAAMKKAGVTEPILLGALKRIPDMDLIVLAQELGIDTDALATQPSTCVHGVQLSDECFYPTCANLNGAMKS